MEFDTNCYKNKKMCDKDVNAYPSTIQFVREFHKTQELCDKTVKGVFLYLIVFFIGVTYKKCVSESFTKIFLC